MRGEEGGGCQVLQIRCLIQALHASADTVAWAAVLKRHKAVLQALCCSLDLASICVALTTAGVALSSELSTAAVLHKCRIVALAPH